MSTALDTNRYLTVDDLEHLPDDDGNRYELIDGALYVTTQPHLEHQFITSMLVFHLLNWNNQTRAGSVYVAPGVIFAPGNAVAPDVVWVSHERLKAIRKGGKLHGSPELVVEILSYGGDNETRDQVTKLHLYAHYGIQEYWIVDRQQRVVKVYRLPTDQQDETQFMLAQTVTVSDVLTSPLLPGFACPVASLFEPASDEDTTNQDDD